MTEVEINWMGRLMSLYCCKTKYVTHHPVLQGLGHLPL